MENNTPREDVPTAGQQDAGNNGDNSAPKPEEKKFSQEQVNDIVEGRLAKERAKYKDYDDLKTKVSELEQFKAAHTELGVKLKASEDALEEIYSGMLASIPEDKVTLIPEQLSTVDRIKFINRNSQTFILKGIPQTPPPEGAGKGQPGLYGGKYTSLQEWASADPEGYLKFRRNQK